MPVRHKELLWVVLHLMRCNRVMTDATQAMTDIEDSAGKFPQQMLLIPDVFAFSFAEAKKVSLSFGSNAELFGTIDQVIAFIEQSALDPEEAAQVVALLREEAEVIAFAQKSRSSVIAL